MVNRTENTLKMIDIFLNTIRTWGTINRYEAAVKAGMTPRQYKDFHQYFLEGHKDVISYDEKTKRWTWIGSREERYDFYKSEVEKKELIRNEILSKLENQAQQNQTECAET